jgi:hypothetical protein
MQRKLKTFGLGLILAGMMTPAFAQEDAPSNFRINNIRSNGTGCPLGTVAVNISPDQQAFTLTFSEFFAEVSPILGVQTQRKDCRVVFDTEQEPGWEYTIFAVTYRGFAALDAGVRGAQDLTFGTIGKKSRTTMNLVGPYDDNYINSQEVPVSTLKWSGCNNGNKQKDFTIDAALTLQAPDTSTQGLFTVDTVDGEVRQEYEVIWRECKNGPKKAFAICRLTVPGKDGPFQLISKHPAKKPDQALAKAKSKLAQKCGDAQGRAPNCDANKAQCSIVNL